MSEVTYNFCGWLFLNTTTKRLEIVFKVELFNSWVYWNNHSIPKIQKHSGKLETFYWPIILPISKSRKRLTKTKIKEYIKRAKKDTTLFRSPETIYDYLVNWGCLFLQDLGYLNPEWLFHKLDINYSGHDVNCGSLRRAIIEELKNRVKWEKAKEDWSF